MPAVTTLPAGLRLGSYEIEVPLGSGGMGTVYRARDVRLGRTVALKHLRADVADDAVLRQRFELEARAAAALNHPNVCTLHDIGQQDGTLYLVMELLEGHTLARRLDAVNGGLPIAEALDIASQVAEALAAAHRVGIVHRDVKPANIMLTKSGVKLLDFGVARLRWRDDAKTETLTMAGSPDSGEMAGTLPYMAPEQLAGQADARADIFALGSVLFEMLTGRRAFAADSVPVLLAAIAEAAVPPAGTLRPGLSPALDRTLSRCLTKDPDKRWQNASDVADELRWIATAPAAAAGVETAATGAGKTPSWRRWVSLAAATVLLVSGYFMGAARMPADQPIYVDDLDLPPGTTHWAGLSVSPDGRRVAVVTQPDGPGARDPRLWMREIGGSAGWVLVSGQGDEIPRYPFWSPDGQSLAYFANERLMRVDLRNLVPVPIGPAPDPRGGAWLDDDTIVLAPGPATGLWKVPASGGTPALLIERGAGEIGLKFPIRVDAGRILYWSQNDDPARSQVMLLDLASTAAGKAIVPSLQAAAFDAGTLFYWRDGVLLGQHLDIASGRLTGTGAPVAVDTPSGTANVGTPGVDAGGGHVAVANLFPPTSQLTWVDRTGRVSGTLGEPWSLTHVDVSSDGRRVVVGGQVPGIGASLQVIDLATGSSRQLNAGGDASFPVWSPDGTRILFRSLRGVGGNGNLYELTVDDPARVTAVVEGRVALWPAGWLPDGDGIVFQSTTIQNQADIPFPAGVLAKRRGSDAESVLASDDIRDARVSPDGGSVAWVRREATEEVFVTAVGKASRPVQVSRGSGRRPRWSTDGRELYFLSGNRLMALVVPPGGATPAPPVPLFTLPAGDGVPDEFAVMPDGTRFLLVVPTSRQAATVKVTRNWRPTVSSSD